MNREHEASQKSWASLKSWLFEALAAFCPLNVARVLGAWPDREPRRVEIRIEDSRRRRDPRD